MTDIKGALRVYEYVPPTGTFTSTPIGESDSKVRACNQTLTTSSETQQSAEAQEDILDQASFSSQRQQHLKTWQTKTGMFAAMRSALGGGQPVTSSSMIHVQMELQQLKAAPILNPHFGMVTK
jgi:hypothetical protein